MVKEKHDLDWSKSFMYSIHQTYFLTEKRLTHRLSESKSITFSQFLILLALHCKTDASQGEIAEFLYLAEATVSRHVNALAHAKYLTRKEVPRNRRKHILAMTPKGTKAFAHAHAIIVRELQDIFSVIPKKNRLEISTGFERVLDKLTHTL